jgi:hypothetical protein
LTFCRDLSDGESRIPQIADGRSKERSMSSEIQEQLEDLKKRIADLEAAEIRLRIQSVGPRGPIGPAGHAGERGEKGTSIVGPKGEPGRDGRDGVTPTQETLESIVAQILAEYHVLDADGLPYAGPYMRKK